MDARELIAANRYMTLATADAAGRPWISPVWFAPHDDGFLWISRPDSRHSSKLAERKELALVIFDSTKAEGEGSALYVSATAALVDEAGFEDALAVYNARSVERGLGLWDGSRLQDGARHRLYRAVALEAFVLDERDERVAL